MTSDKTLKEINKLTKKTMNCLIEAENSGQDIAYGRMWLVQLENSVIDKNFKFFNSAMIWFKNARTYGGVFQAIYNDILHIGSYIYQTKK